MYRYYNPSYDGGIAMAIQTEHDIVVYPDMLAAAVGTERWIAGFNLHVSDKEYGYGSTETGPWTEAGGRLELDHAARGTTPQIAICRAVVTRFNDHVKADQLAIEQRREAQERARLQAIFDNAHVRAWAMIYQRVATTEFETEQDREAYNALLDAHRDPASTATMPNWLRPFFGLEGVLRKIDEVHRYANAPGEAAIKMIGVVDTLAITGKPTL